MRKILLHSCCAICSAETINRLRDRFDEITLYYYNPNIEPKEEYEKRLESMRKIAEINHCGLIEADYENKKWHEKIKGLEIEPEQGNVVLSVFQRVWKKPPNCKKIMIMIILPPLLQWDREKMPT